MSPASETEAERLPETKENFADLLNETLGEDGFEGKVLKGTVLSIEGDTALIDVGLKSEGRVPLKEFGAPRQGSGVNIGDTIDIFVERYEDRDGMIRLSREKARREEAIAHAGPTLHRHRHSKQYRSRRRSFVNEISRIFIFFVAGVPPQKLGTTPRLAGCWEGTLAR